MWPIHCALLIDSPSFPVSKDCKISSNFNTVIQGFIQKPYIWTEQHHSFFSPTPPLFSLLASQVRTLNHSTNEKINHSHKKNYGLSIEMKIMQRIQMNKEHRGLERAWKKIFSRHGKSSSGLHSRGSNLQDPGRINNSWAQQQPK